MTMNISALPVLPKGETAHTKHNEAGTAEFDVKTLLKTAIPLRMPVRAPEPLETDIEEKPQPDADDEASSDNAETPPIEAQHLLGSTPVLPAIDLQVNSSPNSPNSPNLPNLPNLPNPLSPPSPVAAPTFSRNSSMVSLSWPTQPDAAARVQTAGQAPQQQFMPTGGATKPVEQLTAKAETVAVTGNSPSIADALSRMQQVNQSAAASLSGSVPQSRAIPVQSVTSISGQFAQSVRILPSTAPVTPAPGKTEVLLPGDNPDPVDTRPDTAARFLHPLDRAKVPVVGDRPTAQPSMPALSGGNVQSAGPEFTAVVETPEHQIIDAIDEEIAIVGARLKAQAALAVETPASGKLPLLSQIKVDLNPGSLGAVRIEIAMSASGEVEVKVVTAKETTAMMIERGREEVLGGLQSRNIEVRGFNVNTADTGSGTQAGSQQEGSAARFSGNGDGQQSRHVPNGRGDGQANATGPEHDTRDEEMLQQAVRDTGSGIYI